MSKMSFADKMSVLIEASKTSNIIILVIIFLLFLVFLFLSNTKRNKNNIKYAYLISSVFIITFFIATYHASLSNMFKYMMDNLFIAVYFPNLAIYAFALIMTNIILIISLSSYKTAKTIKNLNITVYILMNYLLAITLNVINKNKLDIFTQQSIYQNKDATALIELSSLLFMLWVIFLILYKIFLTYLRKDYKPKVKRLIRIKKVKKLPENYLPKEIPSYVYGKAPKRIEPKPTTEDSLLKSFDQMLTLEDYKTVLKLLQTQKEKDLDLKQEKVEQKEKTKEIEKETFIQLQTNDKEVENRKFSELEELYKSIR